MAPDVGVSVNVGLFELLHEAKKLPASIPVKTKRLCRLIFLIR
jgi:hypothetical protein